MELTNLTTGPLTMSSREIAERTNREHKNVIRDIRNMLTGLYGAEAAERTVPEHRRNRHREYCGENAGAIIGAIMGDGSQVSHHQSDPTFPGVRWERDSRGYVSVFHLDKEHTITLVSGYDVRLRKAIIDRWMELEAAGPSDIMVALGDNAWLRGALLTYTEKVAALEAENKELGVKADALDRIATADGSLNVTEAAKALQVQPKALFQYLQTHGWIYKRPGSAHYLGYQSKVTTGLLEHKVTTILRPDGTEKITEQVRITPKGLAALSKLFPPPVALVA